MVKDDVRRVVSVSENFDSLLIAKDHVCRSRSDNYYINKDFCLRSHTSAHQYEFLKQGNPYLYLI